MSTKIYMKKISMIEESLYEFAKRGRPKKGTKKPKISRTGIDATDKWDIPVDDEEIVDPDEFDVDTSDMETAEELEIEEDVFDDKLFKALNNEIKVSEPARRTLRFRVKGDTEKIMYGVPMAKIGDNAFIFKLQDGKLKKVFLRDIILEYKNQNVNKAKFVNEISKADDIWANTQIDRWRESQKYSESDLEEYTKNIVDAIWKRLRTKLSPEFLRTTGTTKNTLREYITKVDSPYGLYMSVPDFWEENIPWEEVAGSMFDEVYRAITAQYDAM